MPFKFDAPKMAKIYTRARRLPKPALRVWRRAILNYVPKHQIKTVLDLGCGSGRFFSFLHQLFKKAKIIGIDPSKEMLKEAKKSLKDNQVILIQGKAENIPLDNESIDLIFLSMVHHTLQAKKAALEMFRVLKSQKYLAVRQADRETIKQDPLWPFFPEGKKISLKLTMPRMQLIQSFTKVGFKLIGFKNIKYLAAENFNKYYNKINLRGISPLQMLPNEIYYKRLEEFKKYCQNHKNQCPIYEFRDLFVFKKV